MTTEAQADPFLRSGQLIRVLPEWSPSLAGFFLHYPGHRRVPAHLRAFIDLIRLEGRLSRRSVESASSALSLQKIAPI
jgi:DNA-binding transcriptional LysR family regulator